jgi:hypothetical protein
VGPLTANSLTVGYNPSITDIQRLLPRRTTTRCGKCLVFGLVGGGQRSSRLAGPQSEKQVGGGLSVKKEAAPTYPPQFWSIHTADPYGDEWGEPVQHPLEDWSRRTLNDDRSRLKGKLNTKFSLAQSNLLSLAFTKCGVCVRVCVPCHVKHVVPIEITFRPFQSAILKSKNRYNRLCTKLQ